MKPQALSEQGERVEGSCAGRGMGEPRGSPASQERLAQVKPSWKYDSQQTVVLRDRRAFA